MFYLIHKPIGFTSFDAIRKLRKMTGIKKMGHTGTLDPHASGCLLIATDDSTKLISRLENSIKRYQFTVDIRTTTPSLDLETEAIPVNGIFIDHSNEELIEFLESQKTEVPPKYSAIHIDGKRAYDLVRKWRDFEIKTRPVNISEVVILKKEFPFITIELSISAWGYIRSLAPVIWEYFGFPGWGCITYLSREKIGNLSKWECQTFENFDRNLTISYDRLFSQIPVYHLEEKYKKMLIDWLIVPVWTDNERSSKSEILIYCDDIVSLWEWTNEGIRVVKNYV